MNIREPAERERRLQDFLEEYALSIDEVVAEVDDAFGHPVVTCATGSVIQGFGNVDSDVDVYVVVPHTVTAFPILVFKNNARIDICFHSPEDLLGRIDLLRQAPWPPPDCDREVWIQRQRALDDVTRYALGYVASCDEEWVSCLNDLRMPWLRDVVECWWTIESIRRRTASKWLLACKPVLAAQRMFEALWASLEALSARRGEYYFTPKWLPLKLEKLGEGEWARALRSAQRFPSDRSSSEVYVTDVETLISDLDGDTLDSAKFVGQLSFAPGCRIIDLGASSMVTRWDMRAVEVDSETLTGATIPFLSVPLEGGLESPIRELFERDMLWLGVASEAE